MKWNQETIHQWGKETFGEPASNPLGMAIRMAKEAVELTYAIRDDNADEVTKESADVSIVILQVANSINLNVSDVLDVMIVPFTENSYLKNIYVSEMDAIQENYLCSENINKYTIDLISALFHDEIDAAKESIIQIIAMLSCVEEIYDFNLKDEIQKKMEINVARSWKKGADGSHQHV